MRDFRNIFFIVFLLCGTTFSSCKTAMLYTSVDVLRPAQLEFAPEVKKLLIVNNSVVQPKELGHTSKLLNAKVKKLSIETDSLALFTLSVLQQEIDDKDFFSSIDLRLKSLRKNNNFNTIVPLKATEVKALCKEYNADAVLSLDKIKVADHLEEYIFEDYYFLHELNMECETLWSIHYPEKREVKTVLFKDSLFWESLGETRKEAAQKMPERKDALIDMALFVGRNSVKRFIPYWEKQNRYFFNSKNKLMKQAMDSVFVKNWEEAIKLFQQASESTKSNKIKAQAANNIAIAYEFLGNFDEAYKYISLSFKLFDETAFFGNDQLYWRLKDYIRALEQRRKELETLKKQLGEE